MAKDKTKKKVRTGFFKEFKEFISRGNVLDMAVGIIIGGAFTAIVTAIVSGILTPLLQSIGADGDSFGTLIVTIRDAVENPETGEIIKDAIVLDFGSVISAIVTFLLTAIILFLIIYTVNHTRAKAEALKAKMAEKKEEENAEEPAAEEPAAEEPAPAPAPTTEELLIQIRDLLAAQNEKKE